MNNNQIEVYANITGFSNYQISNFGNVKNITTGRILKPGTGSHGYFTVSLRDDGEKSTKLILVQFVLFRNPFAEPIGLKVCFYSSSLFSSFRDSITWK